MIRSSLMERVISFSTLYTYLLQGPSWQSVSFRLTFKGREMKVRFLEGCYVILSKAYKIVYYLNDLNPEIRYF